MKRVHTLVWLCGCILAGALGLHYLGAVAWASEKPGGWRPIYDEVLLWINFGILVFIFVKYGKKPLMNFLLGQKEKITRDIARIEEKKAKAVDKIREINKMLDESDVHFTRIKERIIEQGTRRKQDIIAAARQESQYMLEDANRRIEGYILKARNAVKAELVDKTIELVMERLPQEITDADNEKFLNDYLTGTRAA